MSLPLTDEQQAIQDLARRFAAERLAPEAAAWDENEHFPVAALREAAGLGFASINVATDVGGGGLGRLESAIVFEELSQGCVSTAAYLAIHNAVCWIVDRFGTSDQRRQWLPALTAMDLLGSYCLTEPGAGSDAASLQTVARLAGDEYVLTGTKQFISGAGASDVYLVMARTAPGPFGISCLLVEKDRPGLGIGRPESKMGWRSQPTAQIVFDDCRVPAGNRIGGEGDGLSMAIEALNGSRINIAACSLGPAAAALRAATLYAGERRQFDRPIIEFQATQMKLADMATSLFSSRLVVHEAARALDRGAGDAAMLCAMAKILASESAYRIVDQALQIHGGYGYMRSLPFERWLRDLRAHQILEGTSEIMRLIVCRELRRLTAD
jgi:alkylation response protein AidB-like acyl-CoA dehydrogenase